MNNEEKILVLLEQHSEMFAQINSRLDKMDERLNRMDSRLDKMDERLDRMEEYAEITRDGVNALLGGVLGLVKAALLLFLAVWVLQKLQLLVTPELVNKTVLLKFFAQNSPIDLIAKL